MADQKWERACTTDRQQSALPRPHNGARKQVIILAEIVTCLFFDNSIILHFHSCHRTDTRPFSPLLGRDPEPPGGVDAWSPPQEIRPKIGAFAGGRVSVDELGLRRLPSPHALGSSLEIAARAVPYGSASLIRRAGKGVGGFALPAGPWHLRSERTENRPRHSKMLKGTQWGHQLPPYAINY